MLTSRIAIAVTALAISACTGSRTGAGGPVPAFNGRYEIIETSQGADLPEEFGSLPGVTTMGNRTEAVGTLEVAPILGGEYAEWRIAFTEPAHEIRIVLGPKGADGTHPIWRFEQQPAPPLAHEGVARFEENQLVADFLLPGDAVPRRLIRERWTLTDDGLDFEFQGGVEGGPFTRAGGFVAVRD